MIVWLHGPCECESKLKFAYVEKLVNFKLDSESICANTCVGVFLFNTALKSNEKLFK